MGHGESKPKPLDNQYNRGYTFAMKTAISIPDNIFSTAEQFAKGMGISRSELYTRAIKEYIERKKDDFITEQLNELYTQNPERLDEKLSKLQFSSISKDDW